MSISFIATSVLHKIKLSNIKKMNDVHIDITICPEYHEAFALIFRCPGCWFIARKNCENWFCTEKTNRKLSGELLVLGQN